MEISKVETKNISIKDKYINYTDERFTFKTEWMRVSFINKYKTLKVSFDKETKLYEILKKVNSMLDKKKGENKLIKLINEWKKDDETVVYSTHPKYEYAKVFDEKGKELDIKELEKTHIECRFVFTFTPIKTVKEYYGSKLKCLQIKVRNIVKEDKFKDCLF